MITKDDCMSMLLRLEDTGININQQLKKLIISNTVPIDVLQFIIQNQGLDLVDFYEMLRVKHNKQKSPLYTNIVKDNKEDVVEIITTLSCLLTQIILFGKKLAEPEKFFKAARAAELTKVLNTFFETGEASQCLKLLQAIKTDLLVLEYVNGKREKE